jgi:hypothetical protein
MAMEANLKLKLKLILPPTLEEKEFLSPLNMLMYIFFVKFWSQLEIATFMRKLLSLVIKYPFFCK